MFNYVVERFQDSSMVVIINISVGIMMMAGFGMTRITKKIHLPDVTAYIVAGIIIGPYCLNLVPVSIVQGMDFIADIALAFIAFSTGEFFRFSTFRENGLKIVVVTVFESLMASVLIFIVMFFILHLSLTFSIVLASLAAATAPASTVMTIRQTGAKGDFVETLLQVVALDDVVGLMAYSVAISVAIAATSGVFSLTGIIKPILANFFVLILGGLCGYLMKLLMPKKRSTDNRLIISLTLLFTFCGVCAFLDVSPLLGCMSMGTIYINVTDDDKLFKQLNYFSPPILLLFFVRSGVNFKLDTLANSSVAIGTVPLVVVGIAYFIIRIIGKYIGAFIGCFFAHKKKEVRNYLGLALIPQAGVAIGLAALGARTLGGAVGESLETIILASSVLYELIGPACAKLSLYLSKSYSTKIEDLTSEIVIPKDKQVSQVDLLIERIQAIQKELPQAADAPSEEEQAFLEAAEEQYAMVRHLHRNNRM